MNLLYPLLTTISPRKGFLADGQVASLMGKPAFDEWERVLLSLPNLIEEKKLRERVHTLPDLEVSDSMLTTEQEWQRAYLLMTFIGQAYLRMDDHPPDSLPSKVAKPWVAISDHLGLKPFVSYAALVLYNCNYDPTKPEIEKFSACASFTGLPDESWFYIVHMAAEMAAARGLKAIADAHLCLKGSDESQNKKIEKVGACLKNLDESLKKMKIETDHMFEKDHNEQSKCDPHIFYNKLRPFYADSLSNKFIYEDMGVECRHYHGASAAQTSSIYAFDKFLGVQHSGEVREFITKMQDYMPCKHRQFLERLSDMPSVREFCKDSENAELVRIYNKAVESLLVFRENHLRELITKYIFRPMSKAGPGAESEIRGTGGTRLSNFLESIIKETRKLTIAEH